MIKFIKAYQVALFCLLNFFSFDSSFFPVFLPHSKLAFDLLDFFLLFRLAKVLLSTVQWLSEAKC